MPRSILSRWLPHTTRAALSGLRKRGFAAAIDRSDKERGSIYRIKMDLAVEDSAAARSDVAQADPRVSVEQGASPGEVQSASSGVMAMRRERGGVGEASPPPAPRSDNAGSLNDVIADLADLDANGLCLQWRNHLGGAPPAHLPRWLLIRVLAYRIQVAALGGLDKATQRVIRQPNPSS